MTQQDKLLSPALTECSQCGAERRSLSQHWGRSATCEYPSIAEELHEFVRGLLLGDGSVDGRKTARIEVQSRNRRLIEWMHEHLGWLSRGVTETQREGNDLYRLRTMSHPGLDRYWTWGSAIPSGWELTPRTARPWYACDGAMTFGGIDRDQRQVTLSATDDEFRETAVSLLETAGYDAEARDRRVEFRKSEIGNWLDWLGDSVPGVEHKWADSLVEYRTLLEQQSLEAEFPESLCIAALRDAAEARGEPLTEREYAAYRRGRDDSPPSRKYIRTHVGSWNDALRKAGVETTTRDKTVNPSYEGLLEALVKIRERNGSWPSSTEYPELRPKHSPSRKTAYEMGEFESWPEAVEDAKEMIDQ